MFEKIEVIERGWVGHFCKGDHCRFHRNTLLQYENKRLNVSTIGLLTIGGCVLPLDGKTRYFETRVFGVMKISGLWLADPDKELFVKSKTELSFNSSIEMHLGVWGLGDDLHNMVVEEVKRDYLMSCLLFLG